MQPIQNHDISQQHESLSVHAHCATCVHGVYGAQGRQFEQKLEAKTIDTKLK